MGYNQVIWEVECARDYCMKNGFVISLEAFDIAIKVLENLSKSTKYNE